MIKLSVEEWVIPALNVERYIVEATVALFALAVVTFNIIITLTMN